MAALSAVARACQNHGAVHHLDHSLAQSVQVRANAHGTPSHVGQGEDLGWARSSSPSSLTPLAPKGVMDDTATKNAILDGGSARWAPRVPHHVAAIP